jgi:hypothetical protein
MTTKDKFFVRALGLIFIGWGIFGFFNRTVYNPKYAYYFDAGSNYQEYAVITFLLGVAMVIWTLKSK